MSYITQTKKGKNGLSEFDYLQRNRDNNALSSMFGKVYFLCPGGKTCAPYPEHIQKKIRNDLKNKKKYQK